MINPPGFSNRLALAAAAAIISMLLLAACRPAAPKTMGPMIGDIVATGMVGTRQAWAVETIVSATRAVLAQGAKTAAPSAQETPPPPSAATGTAATVENGCAGSGAVSEPGSLAYADASQGYCFFYPDDFFVSKPDQDSVEFLGPALDKNAQPVRAVISIVKKEAVNNRTLDEIAHSTWKDALSAYHLSNIQLGGQDALVAEDLEIDKTSGKIKQVIFVHNQWVYLITFSPVDQADPFVKAQPDIQRFWDTAIPSFRFTK